MRRLINTRADLVGAVVLVVMVSALVAGAMAGYEFAALTLASMAAFLIAYLAVYAATLHRMQGKKIALACVAVFALYAMVGVAGLANGWPRIAPEHGTVAWAIWQGIFMGFGIASLIRLFYLVGR